MGGMISKVLSTRRVTRHGAPVLDVKANNGGRAPITLEHLSPAGDDSAPLPGDYLGGTPTQGTGRGVVSGYVDVRNEGIAEPGEVRRYSRDLDGAVQATLHLMGDGTVQIVSTPTGTSFTIQVDGTITVANPAASVVLNDDGSIRGENGAGYFQLSDAGEFEANGAKITKVGEVINAAGTVLGTHTHSTGTYLGDGDPVTPGALAGGISGPPI